MGKNYDIRLNPGEPSRESIQRHMDFDALLQRFEQEQQQQKAAPKGRIINLYYLAAAAAAVALLVFGFNFLIGGDKPLDEARYFAERPLVNPPLAALKPAFETRKLNVNQGGVYEYASGSRVVVPAAAFMNDRGRLVEGEVDILYRELTDYVDFFLSGIPMTYDSAGLKYHMESVGMVEIYAEQNGRRLQLAPGKTIEVELVSQVMSPMGAALPQYYVYGLDTLSRNWRYEGVNQLEVLGEELPEGTQGPERTIQERWMEGMKALNKRFETAQQALENSIPMPEEPVKPQRKQGNQPTIELDVADENFVVEGLKGSVEEWISSYRNAIWQISPQSAQYDERAFQVTWESMRLKPVNNWDYQLTLINGNRQLVLIVNPVLVGEAYGQAMQAYEKAYAEYQAKLAARDNELKQKRLALRDQRSVEEHALMSQLQTELTAAGADTEFSLIRRVKSRFTADHLGIWNCDRPLQPKGKSLSANFVDESGETFEPCAAYWTSKGRNSVVRFLAQESAQLRLPSDEQHLLWLVTEDNKLAVCRPEDIKLSNQSGEEVTFVLKTISKPIRSEEELREVLKF